MSRDQPIFRNRQRQDKPMNADTTRERTAIRRDANARRHELLRVRGVLWADRDDPLVLSELASVQSQINACERELVEGAQTPGPRGPNGG
jgi:hypothetical protein